MKRKFNIFKYVFLIGIGLLLFPKVAYNQDVIELLKGSDEIKLDGKTGNYIITGHVVFQKEDTKLYCDSAYYNIAHETIRAYSRVHLNKQNSLNLFCDSIFFDSKKEYAKLYSNVRIRNNEYKLTTDSLDYDLKRDVGVYKNYGLITSIASDDSLSSVIGYFYPKSDQFNFRKEVLYKNNEYTITTDTLQFNTTSKKAYFYGPTHIDSDSSSLYCEKGWYNLDKDIGVLEKNAYIDRPDIFIKGDSLYYSSVDSIYIGKYNVELIDTTNKIAFQGDYAFSDGPEKYAFMTGHVLAKRFGGEDTLYIHADTLYNFLDSINEPHLMLAYHKVKLFRGDLQGICDSLSYNKKLGKMNLYTDPILWAKNAQLSGDTITVYEKDNEIKRAYLRKQGLVITHVDSTNYYNQVAGTIMNAYFDSTEIRTVDIEGNAKTIYFLEEENENDTLIVVERKGMNRLYASNITLRFEKGDIETATYRNKPDGIIYPMDDIDKKEERVEQFKWSEENRPLSWQQIMYTDEEQKIILELFSAIIKGISISFL